MATPTDGAAVLISPVEAVQPATEQTWVPVLTQGAPAEVLAGARVVERYLGNDGAAVNRSGVAAVASPSRG